MSNTNQQTNGQTGNGATATRIAEEIPDTVERNAFPKHDRARAIRFAKLFESELKYVKAWGQWVVWDGDRWKLDKTDAEMGRRVDTLLHILIDEAKQREDEDNRKKLFALAIRLGSTAGREAMLTSARDLMPAEPDLFDSDPMLFGVSNGVVDLRTGDFRPASKEDHILKHITTDYDAEATCPVWEKFLRRIFAGKAELVWFIQRAIGYSLTGQISEQCFFFLYGTGSNGKSTLVECLQELFDVYGLKSSSSLYTLDRHGKEPQEAIARLLGKRFVTGSETEEGDDLAESRVKDMTGGDTLTGRELYCPSFSFKPTHKLWIYGNHRPNVVGNDVGIWRRIRFVPFEVQIPESEKDRHLGDKLSEERQGILNWAIEGCLEWQRHGLGEPSEVAEATAAYREEEDELGEFIDELCVKEGEVECRELYSTYTQWALGLGNRYQLKQKTFAKRISERTGIQTRRSNGKKFFTGISVKVADSAEPKRHLTPVEILREKEAEMERLKTEAKKKRKEIKEAEAEYWRSGEAGGKQAEFDKTGNAITASNPACEGSVRL